MREIRQSGSVEGAAGDRGPYSDPTVVSVKVTDPLVDRWASGTRDRLAD